jgi:hypothetical protein
MDKIKAAYNKAAEYVTYRNVAIVLTVVVVALALVGCGNIEDGLPKLSTSGND